MIYCVRKPNFGVGSSNLFFDLSNPLDYNFCMLTTITELPEYIKRADSLLSESERKGVIDYLSEHPKAGDIIEGTGGIRKIRWSRANKGKSGGVRVIYYYHDERIPLYLLTMFGKNERANLSKADRNALGRLVGILITNALENNHG
jgi:mRNA-degrading endonuclease RelE of RelBE toxin-antitoxin system